MKKILAILGTAGASLVYSQGTIIVNNYSKFDYYGFLIATNSTSGCYPRVGNDGAIVVPAESRLNLYTRTIWANSLLPCILLRTG
ncbi:hypothetical protein [Chryseobacterium phocaeense]|uniref:hypothetical protein n=1 Tax=Chryseobacterium phocaeense TaxID=1816690 RepID=UPI0009B93242|nr:hypothetical protein [Chryseobacterium phocaeense]